MYIFSLLAFSISKPWRKEFYTNVPFMIVLVLVFGYSVLLAIVPDARISIFKLDWMNAERLNVFVLGIALLFGFFMYSVQKFIMEPFSTWLK
jgi:magnesium-transporting ATPase (P-type)